LALSEFQLHTNGGEVVRLGGIDPTLHDDKRLVVCFFDGPTIIASRVCPRVDPPNSVLEVVPTSFLSGWRPNKAQLAVIDTAGGGIHSPRIADFVAWGSPPDESPHPYDPTMPVARRPFVLVKESTGLYSPGEHLSGNEVLGLLPGARPGSPESWAIYSYSEKSPGLGNHLPAPRFIVPHHRAVVRKMGATIAWLANPGDTGYRVMISPNEDFSSPYWEFRIPLGAAPILPLGDTDIPLGTHWVKVLREAGSRQSAYSEKFAISLIELDLTNNTLAEVKGIRYAYQRKDTHMLCLRYLDSIDGYSKGCDDKRWDRPHTPPVVEAEEVHPSYRRLNTTTVTNPWTCRPHNSNLASRQAPVNSDKKTRHGYQYCVMACVSMISRAYSRPERDRCISQDRLAFQYNEMEYARYEKTDTNPDDDLRHGAAIPYNETTGGYCTAILRWALGPPRNQPEDAMLLYTAGVPSFDQIHEALLDDRPIMSRWVDNKADHMRVIDASYRVSPHKGFIRVLDPKAGGPRWEQYVVSDWRDHSKGTWFCPVTSHNQRVQNDEIEVWFDQDGDGIVDFDEEARFDTSKMLKDTDSDGMDDKSDIAEYVLYRKPCGTGFPENCPDADYDGDEVRKELDPDNDGDGCLDGGGYDTDNFNHDSDECAPPPISSCLGCRALS
jgi:hypothetical protein